MKNYLKNLRKYLTDQEYRFAVKSALGLTNYLSDEQYIRRKYRSVFNREIDLDDPKTFNEKIQWLKLHDRNPFYSTLVDKYEVKKYISERIGAQYIIKTLGVWNSFSEIDFDSLPDQFVLKCTHDSGGLVICDDKSKFDIDAARKKIERCLKRNYFFNGREWPYKNVPHRIIAEEYMVDAAVNELRDYKFFCFDGVPKIMFVASDRQKKDVETKFDFFDMEYHFLNIKNGHPNSDVLPEKPVNFEKMKKIAADLSTGIPHVRIDFYEINGNMFFGEMTFAHYSGFTPFVPEEWDYRLGEMLHLPKIAI